MYKRRIGLLLLAVILILNFPLQVRANGIVLQPPETGGTAVDTKDIEAYCAYAIDDRLYAFIQLGEGQDPDSFQCDLKSDDITVRQFQYLKSVIQTKGNLHYIFVIDNSATMSRYKDEISAYFQGISENEEMKAFYTLATFGERFDIVKEKMTDINTVLYELDQITFQEKYTDPYTAVKSVDTYLDSYLRGSEDMVSIVLITDGQPDIRDAEKEPVLAEEAKQTVNSATDVIYSTFCIGSWTETGEASLVTGKGLHELVTDIDGASDAGRRLTVFLDSLCCVCFELEQIPDSDFSFEMIVHNGSLLNINSLFFDSVHNIKKQNQDVSPIETESLPEILQVPGSGDNENPPAEIVPVRDPPINDASEETGSSDNGNSADPFLSRIRGGLSKLGIEADDNTVVVIICSVCAVIVVIVVLAAVLAIRRKSSKNSPQKEGKATTTDVGIPLKLEVYSGRCRNKTALLQLSDCLTIGSSEDCDIIFDNPEVAAENSRIKLVDGQVYIEDMNSPRGTALNGMRFQGRNKLQSGEVISIGTVEFSVSF